MSTIQLKTPKANRKEIGEAFGQNQSAIRRIEAMTQDITVTLPDAINNSAGAAAVQFLALQLNGHAPLPREGLGSILAQLAASAFVPVPAQGANGMRAMMEVAGYVAQPPGAYRQSSPFGTFQKASTTGTALTSGTTANVASLPLAAGTWDVSGTVVFNPAAATILETIIAGVSSSSATLSTPDTYQEQQLALSGNSPFNLLAPTTRIVLANAATVYLVAQATFTTSTLSADGYIQARPGV
ncbi:hypothetical protein C9I56_11170 [Paraburkholderia caribensis]|uniref:hypothetical protein n=1 Tax=Paraburkholderia caribensis TaxID=75105 RepID=UPI000D179E24|nr:hypothetical protein [Paraburkholderia caribensis]PTB28843.1 hypothetical protein C9I56_11170 [Paraburkholderia caribensis]